MYLSLILITALCSKALTATLNCTQMKCTSKCGSIFEHHNNVSWVNDTCSDSCFNSSVNLGPVTGAYFLQCCDTNECNKLDKVPWSNNKLQCYTCNATNCSLTLDCNSEEDRCITTSQNFKGCASKRVCENTASLPSAFSLVKDPKCCSVSLCNDGWSMTQSLVLLLIPPLLYISLLWG